MPGISPGFKTIEGMRMRVSSFTVIAHVVAGMFAGTARKTPECASSVMVECRSRRGTMKVMVMVFGEFVRLRSYDLRWSRSVKWFVMPFKMSMFMIMESYLVIYIIPKFPRTLVLIEIPVIFVWF